MKGAIDIGSRVGDHLDLADVKFRSFSIVATRFLTRKKITNDRSRKSLIGDHAMFDFMAQVDEFMTVQNLSSVCNLPLTNCSSISSPKSPRRLWSSPTSHRAQTSG